MANDWIITKINNETHEIELKHRVHKEIISFKFPETHIKTPELKNEYLAKYTLSYDNNIFRNSYRKIKNFVKELFK